jgi:hypothetical protein
MRNNIIFFIGGALLGSITTYFVVKKKEQKRADEEIEEMREHYKHKKESEKSETKQDDKAEEKHVIERTIPKPFSNLVEMPKEAVNLIAEYAGDDTIVEITEDEFSELDDYESLTLFLFSDGTLTDSEYQPISDTEIYISEDTLEKFFKGIDTSIILRNNKLKADYEILKMQDTYSKFIADRPYIIGGDV